MPLSIASKKVHRNGNDILYQFIASLPMAFVFRTVFRIEQIFQFKIKISIKP